jgi:hypothetical protein
LLESCFSLSQREEEFKEFLREGYFNYPRKALERA